MSTDLEVSSTAAGRTETGLAVPADQPSSAASYKRWPAAAVRLARAHPAIAIVFGCYVVAAFVVPTMAPTLVSDDWIYVRAVEELRRNGNLEIPSLSAPTAIFQVAWGALFATLFGDGFGALRLSTVALVFLGGGALYGLCRELEVDRVRSVLAAALYLFNPLSFVLGFSFMTDAPFAALMTIATYFYARGLRPDRPETRATLLGSVAAALAFLVRPHGALIPLGVATYLLLARRLRPNREGLLLLLRVAAIPATTAVLYFFLFARGVPSGQESFVRSIAQAGWGETWRLVQRLTFFEVMYAGFFVLPLMVAALAGIRGLVRSIPPAGWVLFAVCEGLFVLALTNYGEAGRLMPYIPQFVGRWGLGPTDLKGVSDFLFGARAAAWLTGVSAASALLLILALCRKVGAAPAPHRAGAGLVVSVGLWQVLGVLPPSFPFRNWTISLDRYLLPLLPFLICLALWALRDVRLALPLAWVAVAAFAAFSVAGTRDFLVFQRATWDVARSAVCAGVPLTKLDGGYSWDGYHLWGKTASNPDPAPPRFGHFWVWWWTPDNVPATDSSYVVSAAPEPGYDVVTKTEYSSWLRPERAELHLLHRHGTPTFPVPTGRCVASPSSGAR
ncbi:MAG: glycosyltransferase family 39 protein [Chloroflexota bacterium]|nr:glycosyltransferase family 39 protein [Chloroflexota bacterium]